MNTSLVPYGELERMATAIAKSGLFGVKTPDQAIAIMLIAQAEGRHPALAARDYDVIQGRPAKKSEAMLRDFLESSGKVEWHTLDNDIADATFSHPSGGSVRITWDMKRANAAGLGSKDMWRKYPRQMLRARVVSEGIRTVCPMATSGMYVPEEVNDFAKDITPSAGAEESLNTEQMQKMDELAIVMHDHLDAGAVEDAALEMENAAPEAEEKIYLWKKFDSKQRSAMKKAYRSMQEALKAKTIDHEPAEVLPESAPAAPADADGARISDTDRKRLEARIYKSKLDREQVKAYCKLTFEIDHFAELTKAQYALLEDYLGPSPAPSTAPPPVLVGDRDDNVSASPLSADTPEGEAGHDDLITADEALALEAGFDENKIGKLAFFTKAKIQRWAQIKRADLPRAQAYLAAAIAKRKEAK